MTHDLFKTFIDELGAKMLRVDITKIEDNTFYAVITLTQGERLLEVEDWWPGLTR